MDHYVITFRFGNYTMAAYSRLQSLNIKNIKLASVPFAIKTECDLCIIVYDYQTLNTVINEALRYPIDKVYIANRVNGSFIYKMLDI